MPINKKGREIMAAMKKEYGDKEGENVFYASKNKGTITGVEGKDNKRKIAMVARAVSKKA